MTDQTNYNGFRMQTCTRCDGRTVYQMVDATGSVRFEDDAMQIAILWAHSQPEVVTDPLRNYNAVREDVRREDEARIRGDAA